VESDAECRGGFRSTLSCDEVDVIGYWGMLGLFLREGEEVN